MSEAASRTAPGRLNRSVVLRLERIALAVMAAGAAVIGGPAVAEAHHANVAIDSVTCTGRVVFTIEAWDGADAPSRSIPRVDVSYSANGGPFTQLTNSSNELSAARDFRATGSFQLPRPLPRTVQIMTTPAATWGDGAPPDQSQQRESTTRSVPTCHQTAVSPPRYRLFLPWLSVGVIAVVASRLLLNLRRGVSRDTGARSRLVSLVFVDVGELWLTVTAVVLGAVCGALLTVLLVKG